jgi:hypothetical protein
VTETERAAETERVAEHRATMDAEAAVLDALPDGVYYDGTYEWTKDDDEWAPFNAPYGMPTRPDLKGLCRVEKTYTPVEVDRG